MGLYLYREIPPYFRWREKGGLVMSGRYGSDNAFIIFLILILLVLGGGFGIYDK